MPLKTLIQVCSLRPANQKDWGEVRNKKILHEDVLQSLKRTREEDSNSGLNIDFTLAHHCHPIISL